MKVATWHCIPVILLAFLGLRSSFQADRQKVEEGRYAILRNGGLVAGSEHSWMLWRLPDGRFELEDHFQVNSTARAFSGLMIAPGMPTSPELRASVEKRIEPSDLAAVFGPDQQLQSLTMSGIKQSGTKGIGLNCKVGSRDVDCVGTSDNAKFRIHDTRGLFWWYGIPTLLRSWLQVGHESPLDSRPQKTALLSFGPALGDTVGAGKKSEPGAKISWGDKPSLESADLTITSLGPDTLVLGDKSFHTQKYTLEVRVAAGNALSLTVWTDTKQVILAVENASVPDDVIALVQYKNYSNNPQPVAPTPIQK